MSQLVTKKKSPNEPLYYDEIVRHRDGGTKHEPEEVCLRFVPRNHEINAVYHTPITELLTKNDLPLAVILREDLDITGDRGLVAKRGKILMLHFVIRPKKVFATDRKGQDVVLPFYARQLYDILPIEPDHDDKIFWGTAEVIKCKPLPKHLRVVNAFLSENPLEAQEEGDIIDVSHIERNGNIKVLIGRVRTTREEVHYPETMMSTYTTMLSKIPLSLSDIVTTTKLPVRIRKTEQNSNTFFLQECKDEAQVICTVPNWKQVFSIPLTSTVHVDRVDDSSQEPFPMDVTPQLYPLMNWTIGVREVGRETLPERLAETPHPKIGILSGWINSKEGLELIERMTEGTNKSRKDTIAELQRKIRSLERQARSPAAPPPSLPAKSRNVLNVKPKPVKPRPLPAANSTYDVINHPPVPAPRRGPSIKKKPVISNRQTEIDDLRKRVKDLQREKEEHLSLIAELEAKVKRFQQQEYQSIPEVQPRVSSGPNYDWPDVVARNDDMASASVDDVVNFVCSIGLSSFAEAFRGENVDGALLVELDEDIFISDLGLSRLAAKKLKVEIQKRT